MKIKERLNKAKKAWQLNAIFDAGLVLLSLKDIWDNWQKFSSGCRVDGTNVSLLIS